MPARSGGPSSRQPRRSYARGLIALVAGVLLVVGTVAAFELGTSHNNPSAPPTSPAPRSASPAAAAQQLSIAGASIWDSDRGRDDLANLAHAYDGSSTGWTTSTYFDGPSVAPYRAGSGIVFDLGSAKPVRGVSLEVAVPGATVEVWTAQASLSAVPPVRNSAPPGFTKQGTRAHVGGGEVDFTFAPATTRFVMVWFTALPHQDADGNDIAGYRDTLSKVRIFS